MIATVSKDFPLSYSHRLTGLPDGHRCARIHGHNAVVRVELTGPVDPLGFVIDYGDLAPLAAWLDATLDHRHLNDVVDFNPTAELLAHYVYQWCAAMPWPIAAVSWSETPKTCATYRGPR